MGFIFEFELLDNQKYKNYTNVYAYYYITSFGLLLTPISNYYVLPCHLPVLPVLCAVHVRLIIIITYLVNNSNFVDSNV